MIDIKSEREFLREIFAKIEKGIYAIPIFQRDFVWKKQQIIDFFDSIWNGYPIGSILLWEPDKSMPSKDMLTDEIYQNSKMPNYFVLDGRQRLSAFYGCVQNTIKDINIFNLYFNLDNDKFVYANKESLNLVKVSRTYDTFELLSWMQEIMKELSFDENRAKMYIKKAQKLNSILQGYTVSEVYINHCSLEEAEIVFTRINSKGTDISKTYMLQATSYRNGGFLLSDKISDIQKSLAPFGFGSLSSDDILLCFYKFVGKNFYDAKVNDLESMNLADKLPQIKEAICKSAKFLHDKCYVLDLKILPYIKQFVAMTWFFRKYDEPDEKQEKELRKWFLFTTFKQSFVNGSLSHVRHIFRRFEEFIDGKNITALDYPKYVVSDDLKFTFSLRNARSNFMVLSLIWNYGRNSDQRLQYNGIFAPDNKKNPLYQFVCLKRDDKAYLNGLFSNNYLIIPDELDKYGLSVDILEEYIKNDFSSYEKNRKELIQQIELNFLNENGIIIKAEETNNI